MTQIKEILLNETDIVLKAFNRKRKPSESCTFEENDLETTNHFDL